MKNYTFLLALIAPILSSCAAQTSSDDDSAYTYLQCRTDALINDMAGIRTEAPSSEVCAREGKAYALSLARQRVSRLDDIQHNTDLYIYPAVRDEATTFIEHLLTSDLRSSFAEWSPK